MNTAVKEKPKQGEQPGAPVSKGEVAERNPVVILRDQMDKQKKEFAHVLPEGVSPDRFVRVIMTAVQDNPALLDANRKSLLKSAQQAAQDGLMPDGREGALVMYGKDVQWLPMITGLTKRVRETGQVIEFRTRIVHENDHFEVIFGDEERIEHKPTIIGERGSIIAAYAVLKLKDGGVEREVMTKEDLDAVRAVSRAKNGPWKQWEGEMCRKSVARRLFKRCPLSPVVDQILARDEDHYDLDARGSNVGWRQVERKEAGEVPSAPSFDLTAEDVPAGDADGPDVGTGDGEPEPQQEERKKDAEPDPNVNDSAGPGDVGVMIDDFYARLASCVSDDDKLDLITEYRDGLDKMFPPDAEQMAAVLKEAQEEIGN